MADPRILGVKVRGGPERFKDDYVGIVDGWRVVRPLEALREKTGWKIDIVGRWIDIDTVGDLDSIKAQLELRDIGKNYDIVFSSYQEEPWGYIVLDILREQYGTQYVMDIDDDVFHVSEYNPALKNLLQVEHKHFGVPLRNIDILRSIIEDCQHMTVATKPLAQQYRKKRTDKPRDSVTIIPNMVSEKYHGGHPGLKSPRRKKVVIGWYGSSHHIGDVENSGFLQAVEKIMKKHKHVEFHVLGFVPDEKKYPKSRVKVFEPEIKDWPKRWREMNFDIGCAPLEEHKFNDGKSNIKWQEYSMMGAATVASQAWPYRRSIDHMRTGWLVQNTPESWFEALDKLVVDQDLREQISTRAYETVLEGSLERNIGLYEDYFRKIMEGKGDATGIVEQ